MTWYFTLDAVSNSLVTLGWLLVSPVSPFTSKWNSVPSTEWEKNQKKYFCIFHHPNPSIGLISSCPSDIPGVVGRFGFVGCLGDLGSPGQPAAPAHDAN